jgi:16S rRNA (guanine(966)-N(2))-methyltransferase RsmD
VRQAVMNMLAPELPGCSWLELCCGSGAMACEALRRGAARVVAVDRDRRHAAVARANLEAVAAGLGGDHGQRPALKVHHCEALLWLSTSRSTAVTSSPAVTGERQRFDLIYADPPYAAGLYGPLAAAVRQGDWLQPEGQLLLECGTSQLPPLPEDWELLDQRRYGSTTLIRLKLLVQD